MHALHCNNLKTVTAVPQRVRVCTGLSYLYIMGPMGAEQKAKVAVHGTICTPKEAVSTLSFEDPIGHTGLRAPRDPSESCEDLQAVKMRQASQAPDMHERYRKTATVSRKVLALW